MVEKKIFVLTDGDEEVWKTVRGYFDEGWIKDPDIPYNPYGTENTKLLHLIKFEEGEELQEKLDKHEGIIQTIMVPWPKASTLEELEEAQKHLLNELLGNRGWTMMEHYSKEALLVLKGEPKSVEPPVKGVPVYEDYKPVSDEAEEEAEEPEVPEEPVDMEVIQIKKATGEVVEELDASPEAVKAAEAALESEMPEQEVAEDVIEGEPSEEVVSSTEVGERVQVSLGAKPEEEPEVYNQEDLGCDWCKDNEKCTDTLRQTHFDVMREQGAYQCAVYQEAKKK